MTTTLSAFSFVLANVATCGACFESLGTFRKNVGYVRFGIVKLTRVAEGEIATRFAFASSFPLVTTPWLIEGPTTPMTFLLEMKRCVAVRALAASSCESPCTILNLVPFALLYLNTANWAQLSCSCPRKPAGPVSGALTPSDTFVHVARLDAAAGLDDFATAAAATMAKANTATAAAINPFFISPPVGFDASSLTRAKRRLLRGSPLRGMLHHTASGLSCQCVTTA